MGAVSLASRTGVSVIRAQQLLRVLARTFPTFWAWAEHVEDVGALTGQLCTVFGWPVHVGADSRPTALRNFPMQANGAEMLRLACCLATERRIDVCAPVHDAVLVEAPMADLDDVVAATQAAMAEASRAVLNGVEVATDVKTIRWPARYSDPRGRVMWERVRDQLPRRV